MKLSVDDSVSDTQITNWCGHHKKVVFSSDSYSLPLKNKPIAFDEANSQNTCLSISPSYFVQCYIRNFTQFSSANHFDGRQERRSVFSTFQNTHISENRNINHEDRCTCIKGLSCDFKGNLQCCSSQRLH